MIDKQTLRNDPNIKWQSVADKKWGTAGDVETNALRADAGARIRTLVGQTEFIGKGGAQINPDGTYEIMADAGSEALTGKLKEMLQKTFEEDEELNKILGQLKTMHAARTERPAAVPEKTGNEDSFTLSEQTSASSKWQEQEQLRKALNDKVHSSWYTTSMPDTDPASVRRMEDWLLNGAKFPDDMFRLNMGEYNPDTGNSANITLVRPDRQANKTESKSGEADSSAAPSLFTQAGRTETAQRYDQVLADLRANHDEDEALKLFDEFMKSEGYETKDIKEINFAAPITQKAAPDDANLYSHSYLNASVIDGKEHILASTWVTYSNGNSTYHKKVSDSFDIAADATSVQNGKSVYGMLLDEEGYESQNNDLMNKVNNLLKDASANANLIDSTVTEEEFNNANKAAAD